MSQAKKPQFKRAWLAALLSIFALVAIMAAIRLTGPLTAGKPKPPAKAPQAAKEPTESASGLAKDLPGYLSMTGSDEDRELWKLDDPEVMAEIWAKKLRLGGYTARSGRKVGFMFIGVVVDWDTEQAYAVRAGPFHRDMKFKVEMWPTK